MQILVISLHKLGDNLQVSPIFRTLKTLYPGCKTAVLTEARFRMPFDGNPHIDEIHLFDRSLFTQGRIATIPQLNQEADSTLRELRHRKFDLLINRHSSLEGAALAGYLHAGETRGIRMEDGGGTVIRDPWTRLSFAAARSRPVNPFNFVDTSINIAGAYTGERRLELYFKDAGMPFELGGRRLVAVQAGAQSVVREWGGANFARMVESLLVECPDLAVAFIGSPAEQEGIRALQNALPVKWRELTVDLSRDVPLTLLPSFLKRTELLITNDTGPMHVAAAVGTKVLALYFGESFMNETGPYGPGNTVVHADMPCLPCLPGVPCPREYACKRGMPPLAVAAVAHSLLERRPVSAQAGLLDWHSGTVPLMREIQYLPLNRRPLNPVQLTRHLYYELFRSHIHGSEPDVSELVRLLTASYEQVEEQVGQGFDLDLSLVNHFAAHDIERNRLIQSLQTIADGVRLALSLS